MKYVRLLVLLSLAVLLCCGCTSLRTHSLDEFLPKVLDETTLLPVVESAAVTRMRDGASVTLEGMEVERLRMCFENIVCTRARADGASGSYTVDFHCVDGETVSLCIVTDGTNGIRFFVGEYVYRPAIQVDVRYITALFPE